jgi:hypothetical protein
MKIIDTFYGAYFDERARPLGFKLATALVCEKFTLILSSNEKKIFFCWLSRKELDDNNSLILGAQMMSFSAWMIVASHWHSNVMANKIVRIIATRWIVTFHYQIVLKVNSNVRDFLVAWVDLVDDVYFRDFDAMAIMTVVIGRMRKIAQRNQSAAHPMNLNVTMDVVYRWDGNATKNKIVTVVKMKRIAVTLEIQIVNVMMMNILVKTVDVSLKVGYVTVHQIVSVVRMNLTAM